MEVSSCGILLLAFPRQESDRRSPHPAKQGVLLFSGIKMAYHSKKRISPQLKWSTGDKELFAIFIAVKHFQHLLEGHPITSDSNGTRAVDSCLHFEDHSFPQGSVATR